MEIKAGIALSAVSKLGFSYIPGWICFKYEKDGRICFMKCDIEGDIYYLPDTSITCFCDGYLVPYEFNVGEETYTLTALSDESFERIFPGNRFLKIVDSAIEIVIGIHLPSEKMSLYEESLVDEFSCCQGLIEMGSDDFSVSREFPFIVELSY